MADIVSSAVRSRMMSGKPDIVLLRFRAVILVHGCFWYMYKSCKLARIPSTRTGFWSAKLHANAIRDQTAHSRLLALD